MRSDPRRARTPVWPLSISLAATLEIDFSFSSSGYLDVSVHRVPLHTLCIGVWMIWVHHTGFPHSDICGSKIICISPQLFAAYHVFLRLLVPRHPPCALFCLISSMHSVASFNNLKNFCCCSQLGFCFSDVLIVRYSFKNIYSSICMKFSRYNILVLPNMLYPLSFTNDLALNLLSLYSNSLSCFRSVETERFELLTPCLQGRCSPNWATPPFSISI